MIALEQNTKQKNIKPTHPIPFNKPFVTGEEGHYIAQAIAAGKLCGNGTYTAKCHEFFKEKYGFEHCFMTTSCSDALEMAAILLNVQPGDEVIMPSFTFVSTANAFILRGATIVFADCSSENPNLDVTKLEALITDKTKAIVAVHYAGMACDMDAIMDLAAKYCLYVVEDAAQAIDSFYKGKPLGSIGHLSAFSFHETKNIVCGEGGMLVVNDASFIERAEIIREKGTDRSKFMRGEIDKYGWVDVGSSFLPSEMLMAFLYGQLQHIDAIQARRVAIWNTYYERLKPLADKGWFDIQEVPHYSSNNAHMFYMVMPGEQESFELRTHLKSAGITAVFHYISLHSSPYFSDKHDGRDLPESDHYSDSLLRLPLYAGLSDDELEMVISEIEQFYSQK